MNAGRPAALLAETLRLTDRILVAAPPPQSPPEASGEWSFLTAGKIRIDPDSLLTGMHAYISATSKIEAFFLAYSLQWFRANRKVKRVPDHAEFIIYRDLVRQHAMGLVVDCDRQMSDVMDAMADGEVLFPVSAPEVRVADLLSAADQRRMDAEQGDTGQLIKGVLGQIAPNERKDVARALLVLMMDYWRERAATTTAIFDALSGKK